MKKKRTFKALIHLFTLIQVILVIGIITFENLAYKKMGVMRYLIYKKDTLKTTWFSTSNMNTYKLALIFITLISLLILARTITSSWRKVSTTHIIALLINGVILVLFFSPIIEGLKTYYFSLVISVVCLMLQYCKAILISNSPKKVI